MALEIIDDLKRAAQGNMWTSPARLCVTADGRVVDELHEEAVRLLVGKGGQLTKEDARRYGLLLEEDSKQETPQEDKARQPEGDKALVPAGSKRKPSPKVEQ